MNPAEQHTGVDGLTRVLCRDATRRFACFEAWLLTPEGQDASRRFHESRRHNQAIYRRGTR